MAVRCLNECMGEGWVAYHGDCVDVVRQLPDASVGFSVYSPPFANIFVYSDSIADMGNCASDDEFYAHYRFLIAEKMRVTKPGRLTAVHTAPVPGSNTGRDAYFDFPGDVIRLHEEHGWDWISRHVIWKEPLAVRNRTMAKNLAHQTIVQDATRAGVAAAEVPA